MQRFAQKCLALLRLFCEQIFEEDISSGILRAKCTN